MHCKVKHQCFAGILYTAGLYAITNSSCQVSCSLITKNNTDSHMSDWCPNLF